MKPTTFGEYFKGLRMKHGLTLRKFCLENNFDPGNISRLERGLYPAPASQEKLREYGAALKLQEGSAEWIYFFDLAAVSTRQIPPISNEIVVKHLPILFRTLDNKEIDESKLERIIDLVKREVLGQGQ